MKPTVAKKLFLSVLLVTATVTVAVVSLTSVGIRRSYSSFVLGIQLAQLDTAVSQLEFIYGQTHSWDALRSDPRIWRQVLDQLEVDRRNHRPPRPFPFENRPPRPPLEPLRPLADEPLMAPPPPALIRGNTQLFDAQRHLLIGKPGSFWDGHASRAIHDQGQVVGYLGLSTAPMPNDADAHYVNDTLRDLTLIGGMGLLISIISAWLLARHFVQPLKTIAKGTHRLATGDYAFRINSDRQDEFGQLIHDFNALAQTLSQQEQSRRRWMADTSHELRTPIAVLKAQIEALIDGIHEPGPGAYQVLHRQTQRLSKLVDDLHELARADAGALVLNKQWVALGDIVRTCVHAFSPRVQAARLQVTVDASQVGQDTTLADPDRLHQLLNNLLENSLRYTDAGGRIHIQIARVGKQVELTLDDSAPGVAPQALPHLFERFYREDASRHRAAGGSGLGLAICEAIVKAHGGTIRASHSPLGGLRITVTLAACDRRNA